MFQINVGEKINTHILFSVTFFRKSCRLWDNVEKYCNIQTGLKWQEDACAFHVGQLRLQTHTHNM